MSGGSFDYAYARMHDFADNLRDRLTQQGQVDDGWKVGTWEPAVAAKLAEIAALVDHAAKLAREAEWLYSGDTGEDTFMQRVARIEEKNTWLEGQATTIEHLLSLVHALEQENAYLATEVDKLALDLGIKNQDGGPRWNEVK